MSWGLGGRPQRSGNNGNPENARKKALAYLTDKFLREETDYYETRDVGDASATVSTGVPGAGTATVNQRGGGSSGPLAAAGVAQVPLESTQLRPGPPLSAAAPARSAGSSSAGHLAERGQNLPGVGAGQTGFGSMDIMAYMQELAPVGNPGEHYPAELKNIAADQLVAQNHNASDGTGVPAAWGGATLAERAKAGFRVLTFQDGSTGRALHHSNMEKWFVDKASGNTVKYGRLLVCKVRPKQSAMSKAQELVAEAALDPFLGGKEGGGDLARDREKEQNKTKEQRASEEGVFEGDYVAEVSGPALNPTTPNKGTTELEIRRGRKLFFTSSEDTVVWAAMQYISNGRHGGLDRAEVDGYMIAANERAEKDRLQERREQKALERWQAKKEGKKVSAALQPVNLLFEQEKRDYPSKGKETGHLIRYGQVPTGSGRKKAGQWVAVITGPVLGDDEKKKQIFDPGSGTMALALAQRWVDDRLKNADTSKGGVDGYKSFGISFGGESSKASSASASASSSSNLKSTGAGFGASSGASSTVKKSGLKRGW